jgi:hypothetical protein
VVKFNTQRGLRGPKMRRVAGGAADARLRYLERDGVTHDGKKGRAYLAHEDSADGRAFIERGQDRHQFRFIVTPEGAADVADLRGFTLDLMGQMEKDLATRLDWIALVTLELGHQSEVEAERFTRLDKMLIAEQHDQGVIDLRPREGTSYLVRANGVLDRARPC